MRRYPEYKESGVEWIGEIPKHWKIVRGKFILCHKKEINSDFQCNNLLSLTLNGVLRKDMGSAEGLRPSDYKTYQVFYADNLVFKLIDLENIQTSRVGIVPEKGIMSPVYIRLESNSDLHERYYFHQYYDLYKKHIYNFLGKGVRSSLSPSDLLEIPLAFPSLSEQGQIANFLDRKIEQIDELIRIKERRIELLQEQRTALINQVVTKGLDPNVEMKPSEVEWIGEIPAHWEVKRVKYLASLISKGTTPTTIGREILDEGEIRFIKVENIVDNQIELKPEYYIDKETNQMLKRSQLKENDLLFVIAGATIGKVSFVKLNHLPANTNQAVSFIRPHEKELPEFIYYWLQSDNIQKMIWLKAVQSAQPNLSMEDLGNLYIPYPNIAEQHRIVDCITEKTQTIVQLFQQAYKQIELLKEYRQSLISEAVTGKIDVRNEV